MKIYRNSYESVTNGHRGYSFHPSIKAALQIKIECMNGGNIDNVETDSFVIIQTKAGIISALNRFGGHNNNG